MEVDSATTCCTIGKLYFIHKDTLFICKKPKETMNKKLIRKHTTFQKETSLALQVMWDCNQYDESDMELVNNCIVNDYFKNEIVKKMLTSVRGTSKNHLGMDIRNVAKSYIRHFIRAKGVKPSVSQ